MSGKIITGIERDRSVIRGAALSVIRQILDKPEFNKMKRSDMRGGLLAPPPLSAFRRLEPLGFGLDQSDWWVFNPHDCTPDVVWPLNVGFVAEESGNGELAMSYVQTIRAKQYRGVAHRFGPFMVRCDHAQMDRGQLMRVAGLYVWLGGKWTDAENRTMWEGRDADTAIPTKGFALEEKDRTLPLLATSIALRQRYEWAVSLGLENSPSVRFATDPTGIKDIFRIRDLPDGRDRREALMTWVTDHWRQDRSDPEVEVYVRKHLRGATQFSWRGMEGEILPSQFDIDQRDKAIAERAAMRATGQDRRPAA